MRKILVVDDQPAMLTALEIALQHDFEVCAVQSAEECLCLVSAFQPDLVLTDYKMFGYNGLDLAQKLLSRPDPKLKVVLFSSALDARLQAQAVELGVSACFSKPFDLEILRKTLRFLAGVEEQRKNH